MRTTIIALLLLAACGPSAKDKCRANGGRVDITECHDVPICTYVEVAKGVHMPICHDEERCSWRCADLPAEAR